MLLGVLLMVGATIAASVWRERRARARQEMETATDRGREALARADFDAALAHLEVADRAARRTGGRGRREREAAQLYREALHWTQLPPQSMNEFFLRLEREQPRRDDTWPDRFGREFAGKSAIFDTWVRRPSTRRRQAESAAKEEENAATRPPTMEWALHGESYRVEISLAGSTIFGWLESDRRRRVIFGAQLASLARSNDDPTLWYVNLRPGSCVLLTVAGPLRESKWPDDDPIDQLLAHQRVAAGIEP